MWTIAVYAWKGDTDPPEHLWSAERIHFDIDEGVEWWNNNNKSFLNDFADYDIDEKNKIIFIYKEESPKKSKNDTIEW